MRCDEKHRKGHLDMFMHAIDCYKPPDTEFNSQ